jgi:REP element-mobilizing transposase RayT
MRDVVRRTIEDHCRIRGWTIHALHVGVTHVHIVVSGAEIRPEQVMEQFKAWSTRRLREAGVVERARKVWTEHGSTKWVNDMQGLWDTVDYVVNRQ